MDLKKQVGQTSITKLSQLVAKAIVAVDNKVDALTASDIAYNESTVAAELAALASAQSAQDVTFVKKQTANTGMLASYTFTKGTGASATTVDIDIPKDYVNNIIGIVSQDGSNNPGVFLKVNIAPTGDEPSYEYVNVSGLVEYITSGSQSSDPIVLTIDANHQITASITDGSIAKTKLAQAVQDSLDAADSAYQKPSTGIPATDLASAVQASLALADSALQSHQDISGKADKVSNATNGNFAGLDANGNLTDSGSKAADFATAAQGAKADSALQSIAKGTDGSYVTTSVSTKENNSQSVGVAVTIQGVATAGSSAMGLAEASDVKAYVDNKVASGINYKGSVQNYSALPANPNVGDMYNVLEDEGTPGTSGFHPGDMNYIWAAASGDDPSAEGYKPAHWDPQSPIIVVTECTNAQIDSLFS